MSRRHYRRYNRKRSNNTELWIVMAILAIVGIALFWKILLVVALIAGVIAIVVYVVKRGGFKSSTDYEDDSEELYYENKEDNNIEEQYNQPSYKARNSIMTDCEKAFFEVFNEVLGEDYIVQPQINLASIINKESHSNLLSEIQLNIPIINNYQPAFNTKAIIDKIRSKK